MSSRSARRRKRQAAARRSQNKAAHKSVRGAGEVVALRLPKLGRGFRQYAVVALVYLAAIAGAEAVSSQDNATGAMACHIVLLFSLILSGALVDGPFRKFYVSLALVPLIRIVGLGMPMEEFTQVYQFLIVAITTLVGIFMVVRIIGLRPSDIGLTLRKVPVQVLVVISGAGLAFGEYYFLDPEPLVQPLTWQAALVPALILLVAVGLVEELAFRGVMQRCSMDALGSWGWVYVAALFAVLHLSYWSPEHGLFALGVGLFFGGVVRWTGSLVGVALAHGAMSIGSNMILPWLVSEGFLSL